MDNRPIELDRIALTTAPGEKPNYSPYGYVVEADGRTHALCVRWTHGVVTALLYPELTLERNLPSLTGSVDDIDVFAYQNFEHAVAGGLPLVRISYSLQTGTTAISKGQIPATDAQIEAVRLALNELGLQGNDSLTGDDDDPTVNEQLERMRQERLELASAEQLPDASTAADESLAHSADDDFETHRSAWRKALEIARDAAQVSAPAVNDRAYWEHELRAFDRAYEARAAAGVRKALTLDHHDAIRAAGGLVHSDGDIYFADLDKLNTAIATAQRAQGEAETGMSA